MPKCSDADRDCLEAEPLLERLVAAEHVAAIPETEISDSEMPSALRAVPADKSYDSNGLLRHVAAPKAKAVIPSKKLRGHTVAQSKALQGLWRGRTLLQSSDLLLANCRLPLVECT
jgi:hypothetical protein